jgi:hypothetical protein
MIHAVESLAEAVHALSRSFPIVESFCHTYMVAFDPRRFLPFGSTVQMSPKTWPNGDPEVSAG